VASFSRSQKVSPHYLFEVIAWVGIAMASGHVSAWLLAASMATYLAGR
jgi:very-long-chain enoyl-CoA reductase